MATDNFGAATSRPHTHSKRLASRGEKQRRCIVVCSKGAAVRLTMCVVLSATSVASAVAAEARSAAALRASYASLRAEIEKNSFGQPIHLQSTQTSDRLQGDIRALIEHPFAKVQTALGNSRNWCDILILHPNVKACRVNASATGEPSLTVGLGRAENFVQFSYQAAAATTDYLDVRLHSPTGPLGTSDYRIRLEAAPMDAQRTILHLGYSHAYGARARLAMNAYFSTLARGKVGFTVIEQTAQGAPVHVSGLRGGLERNAMRYYASIESYLHGLSAPPQQQLERRLRHWYSYTERYPLQLQEEPGYLEGKRREAQAVQSQN